MAYRTCEVLIFIHTVKLFRILWCLKDVAQAGHSLTLRLQKNLNTTVTPTSISCS